MRRRLRFVMLILVGFSGCGGPLDTTYGRVRSRSVNGTSILADLLRARGHEVRPAVRLTPELHVWANVIVRFAQHPGPPRRDEAEWYAEWLDEVPGRSLVYLPRDYEATNEYWTRLADELPADAPPRLRERIAEAREAEPSHPFSGPPGAPSIAVDDWFKVEKAGDAPRVCTELGGPWARGVDPRDVKLTRNHTIMLGQHELLLSGDDKPLVVEHERSNRSRILVIASGCFLLNVPITQKNRWPLAARVLDWIDDEGSEDGPRPWPGPKRIAFVEGSFALMKSSPEPSVFALLKHDPFGWVVGQFALLGLAASLAVAPRLGRARPAPPSGADRPVAHPEALGTLLARAGQAREARSVLESYKKWRTGKTEARGAGASTEDARVARPSDQADGR